MKIKIPWYTWASINKRNFMLQISESFYMHRWKFLMYINAKTWILQQQVEKTTFQVEKLVFPSHKLNFAYINIFKHQTSLYWYCKKRKWRNYLSTTKTTRNAWCKNLILTDIIRCSLHNRLNWHQIATCRLAWLNFIVFCAASMQSRAFCVCTQYYYFS